MEEMDVSADTEADKLKKLLGTKHLIKVEPDNARRTFCGQSRIFCVVVAAFSANMEYVKIRNEVMEEIWMFTDYFKKIIVDTVLDETDIAQQIADLEAQVAYYHGETTDMRQDLQHIGEWFEEHCPDAKWPSAFGQNTILSVLRLKKRMIKPENG